MCLLFFIVRSIFLLINFVPRSTSLFSLFWYSKEKRSRQGCTNSYTFWYDSRLLPFLLFFEIVSTCCLVFGVTYFCVCGSSWCILGVNVVFAACFSVNIFIIYVFIEFSLLRCLISSFKASINSRLLGATVSERISSTKFLMT